MMGFGICPANSSSLRYDTACLQINNLLNSSINLFTVSSECYKCSSIFWRTVPAESNVSLVVSAVHSLTLTAASAVNNQTICQETHGFQEHEVASWTLGNQECSFSTQEHGTNIYEPLYTFGAYFFGVLLLIILVRDLCSIRCMRRLKNIILRRSDLVDIENDLGDPNSSSSSSTSDDSQPLVQSELVPLRRLGQNRIQSLDAFRGLAISLMIFVNYGGGKYWFFEHAAWNGLTYADVVFPCFAWVMGASLVLSYRSKLRSGTTRLSVFWISLRRVFNLALLGFLVNTYNNNNIETVRYLGVLQRLSSAYAVVSILEVVYMNKHPSVGRRLPELWDSWRQWMVILMLVSMQVAISLYLPVPGCPTGYLGPGGLANNSFAPNCTGGASRYIDSLLYGDKHLYQYSRVSKVYHTPVPFEPEGYLGSFTTCLTVYFGVQAGYIILNYSSPGQRCVRWLFLALLTGVSAGFLCGWSQEGGLIPVNKQLWSLSFALLTSSIAFVIFTLLYLLIDVLRWCPCTGRDLSTEAFSIAGMNPMLLYLGHIITKNSFPWSWQPLDLTSHSDLLGSNLIGVLLWIMIADRLHKNQIYLTV